MKAIVDTGSPYTIVSMDVAIKARCILVPLKEKEIKMGENKVKILWDCLYGLVYLNGRKRPYTVPILVAEDLPTDMVIGRNGIDGWRIKVTEKGVEVLVDEKLDKLDWIII